MRDLSPAQSLAEFEFAKFVPIDLITTWRVVIPKDHTWKLIIDGIYPVCSGGKSQIFTYTFNKASSGRKATLKVFNSDNREVGRKDIEDVCAGPTCPITE